MPIGRSMKGGNSTKRPLVRVLRHNDLEPVVTVPEPLLKDLKDLSRCDNIVGFVCGIIWNPTWKVNLTGLIDDEEGRNIMQGLLREAM